MHEFALQTDLWGQGEGKRVSTVQIEILEAYMYIILELLNFSTIAVRSIDEQLGSKVNRIKSEYNGAIGTTMNSSRLQYQAVKNYFYPTSILLILLYLVTIYLCQVRKENK